jgi:acyl carrier protein
LPDEIAEVESLPRLPNNKLDRKAADALRPRRAEQTTVEPPSTEVERVLSEMWRETLSLPVVGVNQSFFDVGGDSLLANQVVLRAEKVFGVKIPLKVFFQTPTIAAHAGHLTGRGAALGVDFERVASVWNAMSE